MRSTSPEFPPSISLPSDRLPLLITGITGVPGYNAFFYFREKYGEAVIGQRPTNNWRLQGPGVVACDLEKPAEIRELMDRYGFRSILNCGGSCALKSCELDPAMAHRVNVMGIDSILNEISSREVRLVHLSIDLVFSGRRPGNYREADATDPVTVYGKTMAMAERIIQRRSPQSCILRISLPMGVSFNGHAGAIDWIQSRFRKGKPATLYFDEVRTPTYVQCMNGLYERALAAEFRGLYHAGGPRQLSLYEIAQIVNNVGGYDPILLKGCPRHDAGPIPPRAGNVAMCSDKLATELGFDPFAAWPLSKELVPSDRQWHFDRTADWQRSQKLLESVLYCPRLLTA